MGNNTVTEEKDIAEESANENIFAEETNDIITEETSQESSEMVTEDVNVESEESSEVITEDINVESEESSEVIAKESENNKVISFFKEKISKIKGFSNRINKKKFLITTGIVAAVLAAAYTGGILYYKNHFFFNTTIGHFDCSNMTAEEARNSIQNEIDNYSFTFYEKDGTEEVITGKEIGLECSPVENLDSLLAKQNSLVWLTDSKNRALPLDVEVNYSKDALYNRISQMNFMKKTRENMEGTLADIFYDNGKYSVKDDGTKDIVSLNSMYKKLQPKIKELYMGMSMEKESCYLGIADDDNMKGVLNLLNQYVSTKITYKFGDKTNLLDCGSINEWLHVGEDFSVNIDKDKVKEYVKQLASMYNTVGQDRKFKTTNGEEVIIKGGNYGWLIDVQKESEELYNIINSGGEVEREPVYKQKAAAYGNADVKDTYVEISLSAQHLWFYKNGELIVSSDLVTGNPYKGNATPPGAYFIEYKQKDATLVGPGYSSPVKFWMPFNGGIGLHDASWRGSFGGSIYRGGGSHGCVNLPYSTAAKIYEQISPGDPVILY